MTGMEYSQRYSYMVESAGDTTANKVLRLVGEQRHVLELGPATGSMTRALVELNRCTVVAVEMDEAMAEQARPFCERLIIGDLEHLDWQGSFAEERFDAVIAADVLEHLTDPWRCLENIRGLLRPEGFIVLSIPNIAHGAVLGQLLQGRFPYREKGLLDRTHLRFFTRLDVEDMLLATGFLPAVWERNRVSPEDSEFGKDWQRLPGAVRQELGGLSDADTYQFIVKACPSTESGWVASTRDAIQQAEAVQERLGLDLTDTRRRLAEYRSAYEEASRVADDYRRFADEHQAAYQTVSRQMTEWRGSSEELTAAVAQLTRERDDYQRAHEEYRAAYDDNGRMLQEARAETEAVRDALTQENRRLREYLQQLARRRAIRWLNRLYGWLRKPPFFQA